MRQKKFLSTIKRLDGHLFHREKVRSSDHIVSFRYKDIRMVSKGLFRAVALLAVLAPASAFAPSSFGVKKVCEE